MQIKNEHTLKARMIQLEERSQNMEQYAAEEELSSETGSYLAQNKGSKDIHQSVLSISREKLLISNPLDAKGRTEPDNLRITLAATQVVAELLRRALSGFGVPSKDLSD